MMRWNYRVVHHKEGWYSIHEVEYNKNNEVCFMSEDSIDPTGETLEELQLDMAQMNNAFLEPMLEYDMEFAKTDWELNGKSRASKKK